MRQNEKMSSFTSTLTTAAAPTASSMSEISGPCESPFGLPSATTSAIGEFVEAYGAPAPSVVSTAVPVDTKMIQCGDVSVFSDFQKPIRRTYLIPVTFDVPFDDEPEVGTFMHFFDHSHIQNTRINCTAIKIKKEGFLLEVGTWGDSELWAVKVSWVASTHPALRIMNMAVGAHPHSPVESQTVQLPFAGRYATPPQIMTGFNILDMGKKNNRRVIARVEDVTRDRFSLVVSTWGDSQVWRVGVAIFILSDPTIASTIWDASSTTHNAGVHFGLYPKHLSVAAGQTSVHTFAELSIGDKTDLPTSSSTGTMVVNLDSMLPFILPAFNGLDINKKYPLRLEITATTSVRNLLTLDHPSNTLNLSARTWSDTMVHGCNMNCLLIARRASPTQTLQERVFDINEMTRLSKLTANA